MAEAGIHEELGWTVVDLVRREPAQETKLVNDAGRVRQELAHRRAGITVACEGPIRPHQLRAARVDEREAFTAREACRRRLAVEPLERFFRLEQLELARAARHEEIDDVFGARLRLRRRVNVIAPEQMHERHRAEAQAATSKEFAARDRADGDGARHHH